ncbi:MAG: OmpA family protein [Magnetococcus sp. DMHC-1]
MTNYMLLDGAVGILSWFLLLLFCALILFFFMLVPNGQRLSRVVDSSSVPVIRTGQLPVAVVQTSPPPLPVVQADKHLADVVQIDKPPRPVEQARQTELPVEQVGQPQPPVVQAGQTELPVVQAGQPQPPVVQAEKTQPPHDLMQQVVPAPEPVFPVAGEASNQHLLGLSMCPGTESRPGHPDARSASSGLMTPSDPAYRNTLGQLLDCFQKQMQAIGVAAKTDIDRGLLFLPPLSESQAQNDLKLLPGSLAALQPVSGLQRTIRFPLGEARLDPEASQLLTPMRQYLQQDPDARVLLQGHADRQGTDAYNLQLSQHRTQSAADFFAAGGIHPERMILEGFGSSRPMDPNDTEAAYARNRRVEIKIFKKLP